MQDLSAAAFIGDRRGRIRLARGPLAAVAEPPPGVPVLFAPDFFLEDPAPWKRAGSWEELPAAALGELLPAAPEDATARTWTGPDAGAFTRTFRELKRRLAAGQLLKAVPVVFEECTVSDPRRVLLPALLASAARVAPPVVPYGLWDETAGMVGATPEVLVRRRAGGPVCAMALAGTAPLAEADRLRRDPKELEEHRIVVEHIEAALAPLGRVLTGDTRVARLPHVAHLRTDLVLETEREVPVEALVRALHPTPALGVAPREAAREWLKAQDDGVSRGRFGAPFGLVEPDGSCLILVAIRNVMWRGERVRLGAGAGVVAASTLEREWEELGLKREAVRRMLLR